MTNPRVTFETGMLGGVSAAQAAEGLTENLGVLAAAGIELRVQRMRVDLETSVSRTRRGRLALRLGRWYARIKAAR